MRPEPYDGTIPTKNSLSISLAESAVFLSADLHPRANGDQSSEQKSTLLRGLLILHLVKPTKITSIEVNLTATSSISWLEGIGSRRIEVNEDHLIFNASALYFQASKSNPRRTASIGPGIYYNRSDDPNYDDLNDWDIHTTTSPTNPAGPSRNNNINESSQRGGDIFPRISHSPSPFRTHLNHRPSHRVSVDSSQFQRMSLHESDEDLGMQQLTPIPPYSPFAQPVSSESSRFSTANDVGTSNHPTPSPAPSLEDFRQSLQASLRSSYRSHSRTTSPAVSRSQSVIPEDDILESELTNSSSPPLTSTPSSPTHVYHPLDGHSSPSPSTSQPPPRGRKRFSLSAVSNVIIDAVRSPSPRTSQVRHSREREYGGDRERSVDTTTRGRRGRTMERVSEFANLDSVGEQLQKDSRQAKEKGRGVIAMIMRDRDKDKEMGKEEKAVAEGWKEFKKGTYTFPISFSIPGNAPPTMTCDYGAISWRLKASVHRPGAFKAKMVAVREVITVACPTEGDTESTESINVERHWDQQLQYLISISGRSFYVGGTMPVTFALMPLTKVRIYRLSVYVEERVDYYASSKRIARTDPIRRFNLLSIKGDDNHTPILPLQSDDPDALRHSPLFVLVDPDDDLSEVASNLMGPGPWTLHKDLKLPNSCSQMKCTNKNHKSNITVTHTLKLVMRVERGDDLFIDAKTGKRKLFDIVVQTPVLILSCRCNPEWTSLPQYSEVLNGATAIVPDCPCRAARLRSTQPPSPAPTVISRHSSDSGASAAETSPVNPSTMLSLTQLRYNDAIMRSSSLFERLVSGQESVSGEVPPAYDLGSRPAANGVAML